jgi:hypothetical protein
MTTQQLSNELDFVRNQKTLFEERANNLEGGNWRKNISEDFP